MTYTVGATGWWQALAASIVLLLTLLAVFALQKSDRPGGLLTGRDRRISTSKTIVYVWTAVVAWMVATEALVALYGRAQVDGEDAKFGSWMKHVFDDAADWALYLVFLGGPYAAAILGGIVVSNRIQNRTLQKTEATGAQTRSTCFAMTRMRWTPSTSSTCCSTCSWRLPSCSRSAPTSRTACRSSRSSWRS
jgi:hypothetical protein